MKNSYESENKMVVGFAWYRPEQWRGVRDISSDPDALVDSYVECATGRRKNARAPRQRGTG
jgi:hypothetical protein